ncbi:hypothetical protein LCGC14_2667700, partial [marine sediment metagenome]
MDDSAKILLTVIGLSVGYMWAAHWSKPAVEEPCSCTEGCVVKTFESATCVFCPGKPSCCTVS